MCIRDRIGPSKLRYMPYMKHYLDMLEGSGCAVHVVYWDRDGKPDEKWDSCLLYTSRVNILKPGPGVGGHCIPVDPWFLVGDYPETANFVRLALQTNASMPEYVMRRTREAMEERGIADFSKVGVYGLTYKEDVDDIRESPTLQMLESMKEHLCGHPVKVYDPWVDRDEVPNQVHSMEEFLEGLEVVIVMVGHSQVKGKPEIFGDRIVVDPRDVMGAGENVCKL